MKWIRPDLAYLFPAGDKTKSEVATEQSLARDIWSIISSAGEAGIPRSDIQGRLAMLGRSIRKHPNPTGIVNTVIDRLIASGDVVGSNDSVTGAEVLKSIDHST